MSKAWAKGDPVKVLSVWSHSMWDRPQGGRRVPGSTTHTFAVNGVACDRATHDAAYEQRLTLAALGLDPYGPVR